eukprot:344397-Amphidinium_carterae.1
MGLLQTLIKIASEFIPIASLVLQRRKYCVYQYRSGHRKSFRTNKRENIGRHVVVIIVFPGITKSNIRTWEGRNGSEQHKSKMNEPPPHRRPPPKNEQ